MIQQGQTYSFLAELYSGTHDLLTDVVKLALYTGDADLTQSTTSYSAVNEATGAGYATGGTTVSGFTINSTDGIAYVSFDPVVWNSVSITARCGLLYNFSKSDKSIAVLDFGADKTSRTIFTVTPPPNTPTTAIIRSSN